MPISLEAKHILVETANCLRNQDESAARAHFSRLEPQAQHAVYRRLWEMMGSPQTHSDFGRAAFWNQDAQTAPLSQKLRAVEAGLVTPPNEERSPRQARPIPSGASKVLVNAFIDCGFDPRFDFSGDYMNPPPESPTLWKTLVRWITYIEFTLRSYFSFDPEERAFRQMLLSSAKAELNWAKQTESTFIDKYDNANHVRIREYDFLESASEFYKQLHPEHEGRLYPDELLVPIHYTNHPQASYWHKDCAEPNWENGDLSRAGSWGYWRLSGDMYGYHSPSSNPRQSAIDLIDYRYVPHYLFFRAMTAPSDALKTALREYRSTISSITTDAKCARSFETCKQQLLPKIEAFHAAWTNYSRSHELLEEVQSLFSKADPYQAERDHDRAKISSFFTQFVEKIREIFHDDKKSQLHLEGYRSLKQTLLRDFPLSHSARLLTAYTERWPHWG